MSFWKKIGNVLKKVAPIALPFIAPGVGNVIGRAFNTLFGKSDTQADPVGPPASAMQPPAVGPGGSLPQATVTANSGFDWQGLIGAAAPAVGALASGGLSYAGAQQMNEANAQQAALNRDFQAQQAQASMDFQSQQAARQMDFQRDQSSTAYQRATADMKAAGINPMLAYSQGGAHAGSGAAGGGAAGSGAQATMANALGTAANSAQSGARDLAEILNTLKIGDKIDAETQRTKAQTVTELLQPEAVESGIRHQAASASQLDALRSRVLAEIPGVSADSRVKTDTVRARTLKSEEELRAEILDNVTRSAGAEGAKNMEQFMKRHPSWYQDFYPGLKSLMESLGVVNSARSAVGR